MVNDDADEHTDKEVERKEVEHGEDVAADGLQEGGYGTYDGDDHGSKFLHGMKDFVPGI